MSGPIRSPAPGRRGPNVQVVNLLPVAMAVIGVLLLLSFFGRVAPSLLAITLALILATALNPVARFFERWMSRGLAGTLTVLLVLGTIVGLGFLAVPPIVKQLSGLGESLPTDLNQIEARLNSWLSLNPTLDRVVPDDAPGRLAEQAGKLGNVLAERLPGVLTLVGGGIFTALVTLIMVVFALGNPVPIVNGFLGAVPAHYRLNATRALAQTLKQMGAWGRATVLVMLVTGTVTAAGFYLLGVQNWLVFGILAALGELVPTIGPIVASLPPVLFTLASDPEKALWVAVFVLVFQQVSGFVLAPFVVGGAGGLHPLSVTVGVLLFSGVFGIVGAFLTIPFLILIKAVYQHFYLRDAPDIPDAVAMALISGVVEEQMDREEEARKAADRAIQEVRDAELERQLQDGELDLEAVLDDHSEDGYTPEVRPAPRGNAESGGPPRGPERPDT